VGCDVDRAAGKSLCSDIFRSRAFPQGLKPGFDIAAVNVRAKARTLHERSFSTSCEVVPCYKAEKQPQILRLR
jgi:hypothetical protein